MEIKPDIYVMGYRIIDMKLVVNIIRPPQTALVVLSRESINAGNPLIQYILYNDKCLPIL
ncbi:MAG: hypothetical protein IJA52_00340 [Clostridia bacterium]|nr:hypothetical protein [Clostridia bacterium]